jgi:6-phosphogluconolactonase/glucosamine-6-phosphate isomerase/deaminase
MNATDLVTSFNNFPAEQRERITLTFLGLSKLDQIIVLVFGKDKKKALKLMFQDSSLAEIPSRFLTQPEITNKVTLITDQEG